MAGAGYYVFSKTVAGGELVRVPDIVDMPFSEAHYVLEEHGLESGKPIPMFSEDVEEHRVIAQRPAANTVVRAGRKIIPTVSVGPDTVQVPDLLRKPLQDARDAILQMAFKIGSTARVPHQTPRDTVLAQDPRPGVEAVQGSPIHVLVSDGSFPMPNLVGKPLDEVKRLLAPGHLNAVPVRIDAPDMPVNVVLAQDPRPGDVVNQGDYVRYEVRTLHPADLPNAKRQVTVRYTVPFSWFEREVRVDVVDKSDNRMTVFPRKKDYVGGLPPQFPAGTAITVPGIEFAEEVTVEVYLDGEKDCSYYYKGNAPPVITRFSNEPGGMGRADY